jgi:tetratricopeptide (TPR) repeat protein
MFTGNVSQAYQDYKSLKSKYLLLRKANKNQCGGAQLDVPVIHFPVIKQTPDKLLQKARYHSRQGFQLLGGIDFTKPKDIDVGVIEEITGEFQSAKIMLEQALQNKPSSLETFQIDFELAKIQYFQSDFDGAQEKFETIIHHVPDDYEALFYLGLIFLRKLDFKKAKPLFEKASTLAKNEIERDDIWKPADAYLKILADKKKRKSLEKSFKKDNTLLKHHLASLKDKTRHYFYFSVRLPGIPTKQYLKKSKKKPKPLSDDKKTKLTKLIKNGRKSYVKAFQKTQNASTKTLEKMDLWSLYVKSDDFFTQARRLLDDRVSYQHREVLSYLAKIEEARGKFSYAIKTLKTILQDYPNDIEANIRLGEVQLKNGDLEAAYHQFRKNLSLQITPEEKQHIIALIQQIPGKQSQSLKYLKQAKQSLHDFQNQKTTENPEQDIKTLLEIEHTLGQSLKENADNLEAKKYLCITSYLLPKDSDQVFKIRFEMKNISLVGSELVDTLKKVKLNYPHDTETIYYLAKVCYQQASDNYLGFDEGLLQQAKIACQELEGMENASPTQKKFAVSTLHVINKAITLNKLVSEFEKVDKLVSEFKKFKTKNREAMTQEIEQLDTTLTHYQQVSNDTSVDPTYHKKEIDIYKRLGFLYKKIAEVTENKHYYPQSITLFQDVIAFYKKEGIKNEESILLELISSMNEKIKKSR